MELDASPVNFVLSASTAGRFFATACERQLFDASERRGGAGARSTLERNAAAANAARDADAVAAATASRLATTTIVDMQGCAS